jgi:hypothetical protein
MAQGDEQGPGCPGCGHVNVVGARFCSICGHALDTVVCGSCGFTNEPGARFCSGCGKPLGDGAASALGNEPAAGDSREDVPLGLVPDLTARHLDRASSLAAYGLGFIEHVDRTPDELWRTSRDTRHCAVCGKKVGSFSAKNSFGYGSSTCERCDVLSRKVWAHAYGRIGSLRYEVRAQLPIRLEEAHQDPLRRQFMYATYVALWLMTPGEEGQACADPLPEDEACDKAGLCLAWAIGSSKDLQEDLTDALRRQSKRMCLPCMALDGRPCCPNCDSDALSTQKEGLSVGRAVAGGVLAGGAGVVAGGLGSNGSVVRCLRCGYSWKM